jgi:hypothetical protein
MTPLDRVNSLRLAASLTSTIRAMLMGTALYAMLLLLGWAAGFSPTALVRDPATTGLSGWGVGAIAKFGVMLMGAVAIAAGVTGVLAAKRRALFLCVSLFAALFAIDDALAVHEQLGWFEPGAYVLYGSLALIIGHRIRREARELTFSWPYLAFFVCFIGSAAIDLLWQRTPIAMLHPRGEAIGYLIEDGLKFVGIAIFAQLWLGEALGQIRQLAASRESSTAHASAKSAPDTAASTHLRH